MEFGIDFDEASKCWRENKKSIGNGMYTYKCCALTKEGKPCKREAMKAVGAKTCNSHKNSKYYFCQGVK
jgi:hypothetical protein